MKTALILLALLLAPSIGSAQMASDLLRPGNRVRVVSAPAGEKTTGRLTAWTPATVTLESGQATREISLADAQRLEVSRGRRRGLWTAGGMLVGATVGIIAARSTRGDDSLSGSLGETAEGLANTVAGLLVGGVVGFFVAPERWQNVPLPLQ